MRLVKTKTAGSRELRLPLRKRRGYMNFEKMYVPVFGEDRYMYTIQEIKRAWLGATTVDGMQPGRGGGGAGKGQV